MNDETRLVVQAEEGVSYYADSGMTVEEERCLSLLCAAWNAFLEIGPGETETTQMMEGIHSCQQVFVTRSAFRAYPKVWRHYA